MEDISIHITQDIESDIYKKCLEIRTCVFVEEYQISKDIEVSKYEGQAINFLICENKTPLSTARIRILDKTIKFERIATLKSARGKGLGKRIMTEVEKYIIENKISKLPMMQAQKSAKSFYTQLGWIENPQEYIIAGIVHYDLYKPLFPIESYNINDEIRKILNKGTSK